MRTDLGKSGVRVMGAWSSATAYEKNDIVSNGGGSYISIQSVPAGTALSNSSYWLMIAQKGDKGDKGDTGATGATGATGNGISSVEVEETSVVGNVHTYTLTISMTDGTSEVFEYEVTDGAVTSVNGRTGAVTGLAEDNGYYDEMTVGGAEQLISSTYVEDSVPYVFRTSGGSADIGDREFDEVHGGTIAWNQIAPTGFTCNTAGNYAFDAGTTFVANHKYYVYAKRDGNQSNCFLGLYTKTSEVVLLGYLVYMTQNGGKLYDEKIITISGGGVSDGTTQPNVGNVWLYRNNYSPFDTLSNLQIIDLTQMFGSAIADYIYSLEQSTTGSGVAWFKSLFPKPYYAYNVGQLISISGLSAHKMTGFNQFSGTLTVGERWSGSGQYITDSTTDYCASDVVFNCVPNTTYTVCLPDITNAIALYLHEFDANGTWIRRRSNVPVRTDTHNNQITTSADAYKVALSFYRNGAISQSEVNRCNFSITWDGERDGEYEPYESHEYALDSDVTLRGVPKLDADNKLYYDGDIYQSDGTVQRRYVYKNDFVRGAKDTSQKLYSIGSTGNGNVYTDWTAIANKLPVASLTQCRNNADNGIRSVAIYASQIYVGGYVGSESELDALLPSLEIVYELATPTTESAEPYTTIQQVSNWGTEEYVIAEQSGVALPVGHLTRYTQDLKAKLEMAPQSPSAGNGDYVVRQTNGINEYVKLVIPTELPTAPSSDGNYTLKCTVSGGTATYSWVSE